MTSTLETKAAALEGLDFIETEEDVKAVEAATLKIQSTFRGKKFRSKVAAPKPKPEQPDSSQTTSSATSGQKQPTTTTTTSSKDNDDELNKKLAEMQVQDNTDSSNQMDDQKQAANNSGAGLPEDEAERAATKIQAGFKGYKTRKELEGKLPATSSSAGHQDATAE